MRGYGQPIALGRVPRRTLLAGHTPTPQPSFGLLTCQFVRVSLISGLVPLALLLAACGDDPTPTVRSSTTASDDAFGWSPLKGSDNIETGTLQVPVDYSDPSKGTFELAVTRHLATDPAQRIGTLLVNPGGPGFGGTTLALNAEAIYGQDLLARFDILGWDPRGTGDSTPAIDCIDNYDRYFASTDITPDDPAEKQQIVDLAKEFADLCQQNNAEIISSVGTNNSARDMNEIRTALGEDTISYFGFSYGSELGATWATMFPETVRAAVLDGAVDPTADFVESSLQQTTGFEATLATFLAQCSATPDCAFHNDGNAEKAFDDLMLALDEQPIPSEPGRPDVTRGVALTAASQAMYSQSLWPELEQALVDAQGGDGAGLLALYDEYYQRRADGTYDNSLEAFQVISCMDDPQRLTVEQDDATAPQFQEASPRFAPGTTGSYFCTFFPPSTDPRVAITGKGAGPILVMGTTGDPATPLSSTRNMAKALQNGRLVVVTADQHGGYGVNDCSVKVVDEYLVDPVGKVPADGFRCP